MEGTEDALLVLSHALACVPVHRRFLDGVGDTRVDGDHARFGLAKIEAVCFVDRRDDCGVRPGIACASILWEDNHWLDRIADCGMGSRLAVAPQYIGCQEIRLISYRHGVIDHYRRGSHRSHRRYWAPEYDLQILYAG